MRKTEGNCVKTTALQFTKREITQLFKNKAVLTGMAAAGVILGIAAPFGTDEVMRTLPAIFYWGFVAALTFTTGTAISALVSFYGQRLGAPAWGIGTTKGIAIGLVIAAQIFLLNYAVFGVGLSDQNYWLPLLINCVLISFVINFAASVIAEHVTSKAEKTKETPTQENPLPALLARLPFDKRAPLISISVQDHYVDITTQKGNELLLMRLRDAIKESGAGLQVHRSHWVATDGIAKVTRSGATATITTTDGRDIPVSRTYVPKLKDAGLLP